MKGGGGSRLLDIGGWPGNTGRGIKLWVGCGLPVGNIDPWTTEVCCCPGFDHANDDDDAAAEEEAEVMLPG
jgi:hypothetical protein